MPFKCREERLAYAKAYRKANREEIVSKKKAYWEANKEELSAQKKTYYEANREAILAQKKTYRKANREAILAKNKAYYEANKEEILAKNKAYQKDNKEAAIARNAKHRARKRKQVPVHLRDCPHEKKRLVEIYKLRNILSEATGVQHHVDHMWPLADGGPHWSGNLQIIPAEENMSKNASVCEETKATIIKSLYTFESERSI
jgi:hypothetical protein